MRPLLDGELGAFLRLFCAPVGWAESSVALGASSTLLHPALCPERWPMWLGFRLALAHGEPNAEPLQEVRRREESEVSVSIPLTSSLWGHSELNVALSEDHLLPCIRGLSFFPGFSDHSFLFYLSTRWGDQPSLFAGTEGFPGHGILSFKTGTVLGKQGQVCSLTLRTVNSSSAVSNFRLLNYPLWSPYTPSLSL